MVVAITTDDTDHFGIEFITDPSDVVSPPRLELAHGFSHEFMPSLKVVNLMCEVSHLSHGISDKWYTVFIDFYVPLELMSPPFKNDILKGERWAS